MLQKTIKQEVVIKGVALHSGKEALLRLKPLKSGEGIVFKRVDLAGDNTIPANYQNVSSTVMNTEIANGKGAKVATIEHLMAAFFFLGIDNILVELDAPEVPVVDGSAFAYMEAIKKVGLRTLSAARKVVRVVRDIKIKDSYWSVAVSPSEKFRVSSTIDFDHPAIGCQSYDFTLGEFPEANDISKAKTFGFLKDVQTLHSRGLALGANATNVTVLTENGVAEECKLFYGNDFVRHKVLDFCGDIYLGGALILGDFTSYKAGHEANNRLLHAIFKDKANFEVLPDTTARHSVDLHSKPAEVHWH